MKVVKFGGTSLADSEQIKKVCDIIISDPERKIAVVSAPGKRFKDDIKITDHLISCANKYMEDGKADDEVEMVTGRYGRICYELGISKELLVTISDDLKQRLSKKIDNKEKYLDNLKAAGEDNTAKLVAAYLNSIGIKARYVNPKEAGLILSDECSNARILPESYENLKKFFSNINDIVIFPGFFGYSKCGDVMTFSRGGSDITGSILAAAVGAKVYENFTDVDNVFAASPSIIENPQPISMLSYREMRELSYAGFSVLHEETLEPVYHHGIPVCIKNTNNPLGPGTAIVPSAVIRDNPVVGIAGDVGFCSIYISKYMMNREIGFGRKVLSILEEDSIPYEHIPSGIDNMSIVLHEKKLNVSFDHIVKRIKEELDVDDVSLEEDLAMIMVVGEGMRHTVGIASRAVSALAKANVNIEMINQGSSEVSMMYGVKAADNENAIKALYEEFFEKTGGTG